MNQISDQSLFFLNITQAAADAKRPEKITGLMPRSDVAGELDTLLTETVVPDVVDASVVVSDVVSAVVAEAVVVSAAVVVAAVVQSTEDITGGASVTAAVVTTFVISSVILSGSISERMSSGSARKVAASIIWYFIMFERIVLSSSPVISLMIGSAIFI